MSFLVKCVFWLGLVFLAIGGRAVEPPHAEPGARAVAAKPREKTTIPAADRSAGADRKDGLSALADQAFAKLADTARDQCLAHPLDCLLAAERFGLSPAKSEPARR